MSCRSLESLRLWARAGAGLQTLSFGSARLKGGKCGDVWGGLRVSRRRSKSPQILRRNWTINIQPVIFSKIRSLSMKWNQRAELNCWELRAAREISGFDQLLVRQIRSQSYEQPVESRMVVRVMLNLKSEWEGLVQYRARFGCYCNEHGYSWTFGPSPRGLAGIRDTNHNGSRKDSRNMGKAFLKRKGFEKVKASYLRLWVRGSGVMWGSWIEDVPWSRFLLSPLRSPHQVHVPANPKAKDTFPQKIRMVSTGMIQTQLNSCKGIPFPSIPTPTQCNLLSHTQSVLLRVTWPHSWVLWCQTVRAQEIERA